VPINPQIAEQCAAADIEHGPQNMISHNDNSLESDRESCYSAKSDSTDESGRRFGSGYVSNSTATLPVATPVDAWVVDAEEKPIYEATEYEETPIYKTRRGIIMLVLIILTSVIVSVLITWAGTKSLKSTTEVACRSPVLSDLDMETGIPQSLERYALKRDVTWCDIEISDARIQALEWILQKDEMKLKAGDPFLIQRYTLALLAFELGSSSWMHGGEEWLSNEGVCEWYGVSCELDVVTEIDLCEYNTLQHIYVYKFHESNDMRFPQPKTMSAENYLLKLVVWILLKVL
jgi:hypothetical protein